MGEKSMFPSASRRLQKVQTPIIPRVAQLIRGNPGTISLGQGVVYYGPPAASLSRIGEFQADPGNHKYSAVQGIPELLNAIATKLRVQNELNLEGTEIVVTAGSNMAFYSALLAISEPGDEIIIAYPYYFNHEMAIRMAGCEPVLAPVNAEYQLDPVTVEQNITSRTRAVVTISPNNPCGVVYPESTLRSLTQLCRKRGIYHFSDEAYEDFTFGESRHFSPASAVNANEHCISLFSMSKAYGFASWRIGYMVIPSRLFDNVMKIQDTLLICPPVVSQYAAVAALEEGPRYFAKKMPLIRDLRRTLLDRLETLGSVVETPVSQGAFYVLLKVNMDMEDMRLVEALIRQYSVAVIPGSAFGIRDGCYLRIAFAALDRLIAERGINRLIRGISELVGRAC